MEIYKISPNKYEPFIDYLKGICIICVLVPHTFPQLSYLGGAFWCKMAVPLFLLIQVIHSYKLGVGIQKKISIKKICKRILIPFFVIQFFAILLELIFNKGQYCFINVIIKGGLGPGSYYPWMYCQLALLLPMFGYIFSILKNKYVILVSMLIISVLQEFIFCFFCIGDDVWRLYIGRYIFLIYLGYLICKNGISLSFNRGLLSIISIVALLIFDYVNPNLESYFYNSGWNLHRWICYFYPVFLLLYLIRKSFDVIQDKLKSVFIRLGQSSYEIFMLQMLIIPLSERFTSFLFNGWYLRVIVHICICIPLSILGGLALSKKQ